MVIEIGAYAGVATAILTQIVKLIPWFDTKTKKRWLAFGIALVVSGYAVYKENKIWPVDPFEAVGTFGLTLSVAFGLYKAIIE